jgi:hypothetical protein
VSREELGQTRVEIKPGAFVWMNERDRKAHEAAQDPNKEKLITSNVVETASVEPTENAAMPKAQAKRAGAKS